MDMKQDMRHAQIQKLGLVMTPKLQQAIKLLQVPALELQQMLKQELMTNPMLEEPEENEEVTPEETVPEKSGEDEGELKTSENEIDWDRYLRDGFEMGSRAAGEREEAEHSEEPMRRVPVVKVTLQEHLMSQLRMVTDSEENVKIGEFIVGNLDSDGFLDISTEEMAKLLSVEDSKVIEVLSIIKTLDPVGVGAVDLRECLLIQLEQAGLTESIAYAIVNDHFKDFLQRRYPEISRKLKRSVQDIQAAEETIGKLDPRPGARFSTEEPHYIVPDLIVEKVDDDYVVQMNDRNVPRLRINRAYKKILLSAKSRDKEEHKYVTDKLNSARWLIHTIEQRRQTMIKVMQSILEVQREFFDRGIEHLKPLTLQQIAELVEMHESTVSRVTNGKYVQTPRGVFELKYFFSTGLKTDNGEAASSKRIKARISEIIDKEDGMKPLSDQDIAEMLKEDGFIVARRTVAKYRDQLRILPARKRKRY
jgi:RNA polymerase sigma-54 factor